MNLVKYNTPKAKVLRTNCEPVTDIASQVHPYLLEAHKIMEREGGIGIAAPQIGLSLRWYLTTGGKVYINPTLTDFETPYVAREGCLSVPGKAFFVNRYKKCTVHYTDTKGLEQTEELAGRLSEIHQHEIDHINGRLIVDYGERIKE